MHPTQTGIAVAAALVVVLYFLFFGTASPFSMFAPSNGAPAQDEMSGTTPNQPATSTMALNASELQLTDVSPGLGVTAEKGDTVTVNYVGALTDGKVFDASANHGSDGFTFELGAGKVIRGWDQGIVGMKEGGKRVLVIPPALAYGDQAIGNVIPANSTLVFEVELIKVQKGAQ
jgi:FKBP-type peptidyl-prolyl cis-trans isomerase FkpA